MKTLPRTKGIDLLPLPVWTMLTQKARRNYHVFITSDLFSKMHLTLRRLLKVCYLPENKLAEACASRTHRRHQGCRPPVLKTGTVTGRQTLPLLTYLESFQQTSVFPHKRQFKMSATNEGTGAAKSLSILRNFLSHPSPLPRDHKLSRCQQCKRVHERCKTIHSCVRRPL